MCSAHDSLLLPTPEMCLTLQVPPSRKCKVQQDPQMHLHKGRGAQQPRCWEGRPMRALACRRPLEAARSRGNSHCEGPHFMRN